MNKKKNLILVPTNKKNYFNLVKEIKHINNSDAKFIKKNYLDKNKNFLIIKNFGKDPAKIKNNIIKFSKNFGLIMAQDRFNRKFIEITPDVKNINKKNINLRYHQTNKGGYIHSDGPQLLNPPNYVLMACMQKASRGGYSILSSIKKVLLELKKNDKKTLSVLKKKFLFEKRGFYFKGQKKIFKKPIFEIYNREFKFRYLRDYINEAYKIKSINLQKSQKNALDKLDKLLSKKKNQYIFKLNEGEVLLINNYKLAHGRSGFDLKNNRSLMRVWFK